MGKNLYLQEKKRFTIIFPDEKEKNYRLYHETVSYYRKDLIPIYGNEEKIGMKIEKILLLKTESQKEAFNTLSRLTMEVRKNGKQI